MSDDENQEFQDLFSDVKPLLNDKVPVSKPKPAPRPRQLERERDEVLQASLDGYDGEEYDTGEELYFSRPGLARGTDKRLRRGQLSVQAHLDLHGMTAPVARAAVTEFIREAQHRSLRCVRIVHGKGLGSKQGKPVLKRKLANWLRQRDDVLAYCSARPVDGGTGAVYVLLRRGNFESD